MSYRGTAQRICFHSNAIVRIKPLSALGLLGAQHRDFPEFLNQTEEQADLFSKLRLGVGPTNSPSFGTAPNALYSNENLEVQAALLFASAMIWAATSFC
jgi:hypothetical protein